MPETAVKQTGLEPEWIRHQGRVPQISIYLGKFLRMFVYQNDWKVLPMAAVIASLLAMVVRSSFFLTMEGTLTGAFALTCVAIWNGCFNSIQVVCRERDVIKREHRAGMHISSYVIAHLIYQAILCLLQTAITMYVFRVLDIQFPKKALFTPWMIVDIGITVFLITFAADALSLWISSLSRNTTTAMTVMPFILIFQLVFSGSMLDLPAWSRPISNATISRYGLTALSAQADYNDLPLVSLWWTLDGMRDSSISATVTAGQVIDYLSDENNPGAEELRETQINETLTVRELANLLKESVHDDAVKEFLSSEALLNRWGSEKVNISFTVGEAVDSMAESPILQDERDRTITLNTTIGQIIESVGENRVYQAIQDTAAVANRNPEYEYSRANVASCWVVLLGITVACAALATITLEFIDKDKR